VRCMQRVKRREAWLAESTGGNENTAPARSEGDADSEKDATCVHGGFNSGSGSGLGCDGPGAVRLDTAAQHNAALARLEEMGAVAGVTHNSTGCNLPPRRNTRGWSSARGHCYRTFRRAWV
jgi:hypothetical protein